MLRFQHCTVADTIFGAVMTGKRKEVDLARAQLQLANVKKMATNNSNSKHKT